MFSRIRSLYTPDIWASFLGQVMSALGIFMIFPFLTLYLNKHLNIPLMTTMAVVSIAPATGFLAGLAAGAFADRFGRKPAMMLSLLGLAIAMVLYGYARNAVEFAAITAIEGMFSALYRPALNARVTDVVTEERRAEVFSFLRVGFNMGAAVGPAIGAFLLMTEPRLLFDIAATCVTLTAAIVWVLVPESKPAGRDTSRLVDPPGPGPVGSVALRGPHRCGPLGEYRLIIVLTLLNVPVALLYAQAGTSLPIHLSHHFTNYTHVIAVLYLFGAGMVTFFQMIISRLLKNVAAWIVIAFSFLAFAIASFGYGWAPSVGILLANEFVFTIGEMIGVPQLSHIVSLIAPEDKRASYFAIFGLRMSLGEIIGPLLGGWLMTTVGGGNLFRITGLLILAGGVGTILVVRRPQLAKPARLETNLRP
ncbi:MAG TPA: MFS transporter [Spirochaetia bacterium]|nr:MFS transporter [Spirochaetia bacterium]